MSERLAAELADAAQNLGGDRKHGRVDREKRHAHGKSRYENLPESLDLSADPLLFLDEFFDFLLFFLCELLL
jgi:hypothetical protein